MSHTVHTSSDSRKSNSRGQAMTIMDGGVGRLDGSANRQQQSQQKPLSQKQQSHQQQKHHVQTSLFGSTAPTISGGAAAGQFPASFPDSFKDFFAMLNEEDDHVDVFSNILEDKDIPRSTKSRYSRNSNAGSSTGTVYAAEGGPLSAPSYNGNRSFRLNVSNAASNYNFGRSSSFRLNRNKPSYADNHSSNVAGGGQLHHGSQQQLLINNIRNQLGGSGLIPSSSGDIGSCLFGEEGDKTMQNLTLIRDAIVDRSPSSSALTGFGQGGLTVTGLPTINRSKSNSKIDDRSPTSFEMKNFEYGGGMTNGSGGRNFGKIGDTTNEVNEDTLNSSVGGSSSSHNNKSLSSKMTKTTTSYCFMRHHQQQQQQQQSQQPSTKPPHHSRNNSLRVHRSNPAASISPSATIISVFNHTAPDGTPSASFPVPTGATVVNCPTGNCQLGSCCCYSSSKDFLKHQKSPVFNRRRSSSISVARPTPDLYRFLKAEIPPPQSTAASTPGARFEPRDMFAPLTASSKGSTLASSTSTMSTLVESVSGGTATGTSSGTAGADPSDTSGVSDSHNNNNRGTKLQQQTFNLSATRDGGGGSNLPSSPSATFRLMKHCSDGSANVTVAPPQNKAGRYQNEENDGNFHNQQQQQQHSSSGHPAAHRTVSISSTAIVCGGRDGSRTPVPPGGAPPMTDSRQRMRTSSMPAENRKPRLADTRRSAIHCADMDIEYYRLRSFSITSHGICNLGDSMRSRRSRSINSVTSGGSGGGKDRKESGGSQSQETNMVSADGKADDQETKDRSNAYKVAMLGASGVGKTALTYQFTTSEYICAYDLSLDDDYGQKTVSVLLDGQETDLEIIDHPACEMSEEAFCSTYHIDIFVVVYSVVDRGSFKKAEKVLHFLKDGEMLLTRGVILVGNKTDLERQREVPTQAARRLAKEIGAKFIETSSGMDFNVDELLVGIVAQVKLNPQRINRLSDKQRNSIAGSIIPQPPTQKESPINKGRKTAMSMRELTARDAASRMRRIVRRSSIGKFGSEDDDDTCELGGDKRLHRRTQGGFHRSDEDGESDDERSTDNETNALRRKRFELPSGSAAAIARFEQMQQDVEEGHEQQKNYTTKRFNLTDSKSGLEQPAPNRFANRTKLLLTSFLKFKRNLRVKRRSSGSCSDLFVI
ncbi:serine-rich adhesin for platelets [Toxorhynchites rutilus septentrionalis]|uniref:serine-rich adhesin for platelets n=1 Tax=Toxorhynchites rutilus septentrionalis TaxID=329112 RepID=UPI002478B137|nr:serine-rich adhesin for platelets [Toxorhynchites rutilus septentrionalis]